MIWSVLIGGALVTPPHRPVRIDDLLAIAHPASVRLSPDGHCVAYALTQPHLAANSYSVELYVVSADHAGPPRHIATLIDRERETKTVWGNGDVTLAWVPWTDAIVYVATTPTHHGELRLIHTKDGRETVVVSDSTLPNGGRFTPTNALEVSPDGRWVSVVASFAATTDTSFRQARGPAEATVDWEAEPRRGGRDALYVVDLASGRIRAATDSTLTIATFNMPHWSPDSRHVAFIAAPEAYQEQSASMHGEVYVADVEDANTPRRLTDLPGMNQDPVWSPDGRWIAFGAQPDGDDWMFTTTLAIISAAGGPVRFPARAFHDTVGARAHDLHWAPGGDAIYVESDYHLTRRIFRVPVSADAASLSVERVSTDDREYGSASYSADGRRAAFLVQDFTTPPDVYIASLDHFAPRPLTHVNPQWDSLASPKVETVQWRSPDDRWNLQGLVILPSDAGPKLKHLPLLTEIEGGPSMIRRWFDGIPVFPPLVFAAEGYAVFIPNTRGRGGFGEPFIHAIRNSHDYVHLPVADVLSGIDHLIASGLVDTTRLGVMGFSYGATLTANSIIATDRFKAAEYCEGTADLLSDLLGWPTTGSGLMRDMWGFERLFDSTSIANAITETAMFQLQRVHTPVLLEAGANSAWAQGVKYFRGLQGVGVPSELNVYPRSGHGWNELALLRESYERITSWFDYWVLGHPYRDPSRQHTYDAWRNRRAHH